MAINGLCTSQEAQAQNPHYSQFYADAIRINPSMTGNFNGDYRFGLNAKSQWESVPGPYRTVSAYGDFNFARSKQRKKTGSDWLAAGLHSLYDSAGDGVLSALEVRGALAAHKSFNSNFYASLGADIAFHQRKVDYDQLYFNNQWADIDFDPNIDDAEAFASERSSYFDVGAGATLTYYEPGIFNVYVGGSMLHINQPTETFYNTDNRLGMRMAFNAGGSVWVGQVSVEPAIYFSSEKKASEMIFGSNFAWAMGSDDRYRDGAAKVYLGAWYRNNDALIALTGVEINNNRILLSYDINVSTLRAASNGRGGFEISYVHVGPLSEPKMDLYCPRF